MIEAGVTSRPEAGRSGGLRAVLFGSAVALLTACGGSDGVLDPPVQPPAPAPVPPPVIPPAPTPPPPAPPPVPQPPPAPTISQQPASTTVSASSDVVFAIAATASGTLTV